MSRTKSVAISPSLLPNQKHPCRVNPREKQTISKRVTLQHTHGYQRVRPASDRSFTRTRTRGGREMKTQPRIVFVDNSLDAFRRDRMQLVQAARDLGLEIHVA